MKVSLVPFCLALVLRDNSGISPFHTHTSERGDIALFPGFLSTLNRYLDSLGMQLVHSTMEDSPARWYALVNRSQDPAAKIASNYTPAELELFNKVVGVLI